MYFETEGVVYNNRLFKKEEEDNNRIRLYICVSDELYNSIVADGIIHAC